jgi:Tol biopolymer transport system component
MNPAAQTGQRHSLFRLSCATLVLLSARNLESSCMANDKLAPAPSTTATTEHLQLKTWNVSRFDKMVLLIMALLVAAIGLTVLMGDRVGVTLERFGPLRTARSTSNITLQFSELMNKDTVASRLRVVEVQPGIPPDQITESDIIVPVEGELGWNGKTAIFKPAAALEPGASYMVALASGAESEGGRLVLSEYRYDFQVRRPQIAYLAPANSAPFNIWIADAEDPESARQVTFSPTGINDFSVSPDGTRIAFSEKNTSTGTSDIKLLDIETGAIQQITNCVDADCRTPTWRPDGQVIGYERVELNSDFDEVGVSPTRIWLIDLGMNPPTTRPLFSDTQMLGYGLQWSADGNRITVFDYGSQGILLHQFNPEETTVIPSRYGNSGALSPDGTRVVWPEIILEENQARSYLTVVNLETQEMTPLTAPTDPVDDQNAAWSPDGTTLAIGRRYLDDRYTRGKQLYLVNPDTGSAEELLVDPLYQLGSFTWDPNGDQLLLQRFPDPVALDDPENPGLPEVWTIDLATKTLTRIAHNAFYPRWVP